MFHISCLVLPRSFALDSSRSSLLRGDPQFTRTSRVKSPLRAITVPAKPHREHRHFPASPFATGALCTSMHLTTPTNLQSRRLTGGEGHTFMLTYNCTFKCLRDLYDPEKTYRSGRAIFEEEIIGRCKPTTAYGCMHHSCYMILCTMGYEKVDCRSHTTCPRLPLPTS